MTARAALRSVLVVNRPGFTAPAAVVVLAAALLAATAAWLEAGLRDDLPLLSSVAGSFAGTVLLVTVLVVTTVLSAALRRRRHELALLCTVGATPRQVHRMVGAETLALLVLLAPLGAAAGTLLAPRLGPLLRSAGVLPAGAALGPSVTPVVAALAVLAPAALGAARLAAREVTRVSPTAAVRRSAVDPAGLPRGRRAAAAATAGAGVLAAGTPFVVPGMLGTAAGVTSAVLLVVAAGLAGPLLERAAAARVAAATRGSSHAALTLAVANARGFSRRLSGAVVPLALLVAVGTVQTGVDGAVAAATAEQLRAGVRADLVAVSPDGVTPAQAAAIEALPGVAATATTAQVEAAVRIEGPDEDLPWLDGLQWEPTALRAVGGAPLLDPGVRAGTLADLDGPGTVAVSAEALAFTGKGVGDTVDVRRPGAAAERATVVAVYDRGLAFGDLLVAGATAGGTVDAVLVATDPGSGPAVRAAIAGLGLRAVDGRTYAGDAADDAAAGQRLSLVLLLSLLGFVAAAAAGTLAASTAGRRGELALLRRTGATRPQLMAMAALETLLVVVTAVAVGTVAVLPALAGAGYGLLGTPVPALDLRAWGGFSLAAAVVAALTIPTAVWRLTAPPRTVRTR
ncbi:FtsX-like permease family protein [Puerhibacterium puerhi]|uniref:FtsX-like permease family protein n=1 Tax=Puerhibacterium puerhi TaxID=2692623 RepID=UPI00135C178A|nr:FtsX-like permease family protein [Puerhibacterium puerhi]